jgi:hypothetical protein
MLSQMMSSIEKSKMAIEKLTLADAVSSYDSNIENSVNSILENRKSPSENQIIYHNNVSDHSTENEDYGHFEDIDCFAMMKINNPTLNDHTKCNTMDDLDHKVKFGIFNRRRSNSLNGIGNENIDSTLNVKDGNLSQFDAGYMFGGLRWSKAQGRVATVCIAQGPLVKVNNINQ